MNLSSCFGFESLMNLTDGKIEDFDNFVWMCDERSALEADSEMSIVGMGI